MAYADMEKIPAFDIFKLFSTMPASPPIGPILEQIGTGMRGIAEAQMSLFTAVLKTNLMVVEACFNRADAAGQRVDAATAKPGRGA